MKKYTRLALLLIAFFSVLIMLVYRYKYYNLRSLVEIMNFFTAAKAKSTKCLSGHSNNNLTSEITLNTNHWTEIFDGVYVYSLHVISRHVTSLAYSSGVSITELKSIKCSLWFDSQKKNVQSNLDVHLLNGKSASFLYYIECRSVYDFGDPNAVTFMKNNISVTLPVFHKQQYTGPFAACVSPLSPVFSDENKVIEFLIYHSHLGIKHFLLYYTAFSAAVRELLISLADECDIIIEFLPWVTPLNFKRNRIKLQPYFIDCIFHISSLNHSDFVFLLDLNNFVILKETSNLKELVHNNSPFDFLQLEKKMFCLEYPDDLIAKELNINFSTLLKTKVSYHGGQQMNVMYDVKQMMSSIGKIPEGFERWLLIKNMQSYKKIKSMSASVFSYEKCGEKSQNLSDKSYTENKEMWSFKRAFFDSCIYKHAKSISIDYKT